MTVNHYMRLSLSPSNTNDFFVRKALQNALGQTFGLTSAGIQLDVLWLAEDGTEVVIRAPGK